MHTITLALKSGPMCLKPIWCGKHLAVHRPVLFDGALSKEAKCWQITHISTGRTVNGRFAIDATIDRVRSLCRLWDPKFAELRSVNDADAWARKWGQTWKTDLARISSGLSPEGPILPDHPTTMDIAVAMGHEPAINPSDPWPVAETPSRLVGEPTEQGWPRIKWMGRLWPVPTIGEVEAQCFDSVALNPRDQQVEPDAKDSWPSLLGLI